MIYFVMRRLREQFFVYLFNAIPNFFYLNNVRRRLLQGAGVEIGVHSHVCSPLTFDNSLRDETTRGLKIGYRSFINSEVRLSCRKSEILIGNRCMIGPRVCFETSTHNLSYVNYEHDPEETRLTFSRRIIVCDGVWIGAGAILLCGITIGERSVIAAGSVVTRDVEPDVLVGGVPAKVIRSLIV